MNLFSFYVALKTRYRINQESQNKHTGCGQLKNILGL